MASEADLIQRVEFLSETEKLKGILRCNRPMHQDRRENSAEHSWSLALMAMLLADHADENVDQFRVLKMLIVHDLVEINAGDTFIYDAVSDPTKRKREEAAGNRLFNLLPEGQAAEFLSLWREFEDRETPEAKFAGGLDRLCPLLQNLHHRGNLWRERGIFGTGTRGGSTAFSLDWEYAALDIRFHCPPRLRSNR